MDSEKLLKNTHFGISRDSPREISETRKDLWPDFKAASDKYGSNNVKMLFQAAISVHGEVIRNLFPDWHRVLRGSRNSDVASRIDQRFKKITADYAISVDTQQPRQSTEPQKEPKSVQEVQSASDDDESDTAIEEPEVRTETPRRPKGMAPAAPNTRGKKLSPSTTKLSSKQPGYLMQVHPVLKATPATSPRQATGNTVIDNPTTTVVYRHTGNVAFCVNCVYLPCSSSKTRCEHVDQALTLSSESDADSAENAPSSVTTKHIRI
ncbi:hypothetical protein DPMN_053592 [Dreissena polymorpha]|uniref:Uncharacterized protein n=1 Tax=Dreissena polymorpha TaxID=45954 RepID=A0A9D4CLM9_DREPO|nr:hypothetical protein DPMN_053592 [Dreissena polymorpha]